MGKFKARYIVIPVLVLAIAGGGVTAIKAKKEADSVVKVVEVSELDRSMWFSGLSDGDNYSGTLKKGSVSNVTVDSDLVIEEVNVKKGDSVKKGDVLLTYETGSLELNAEEASLNVKMLENEITIATNELNVLKKLQPSENAPQDNDDYDEPESYDEPEMSDTDTDSDSDTAIKYEKKITPKSEPLAGTGLLKDPYMFIAGEDTVVTKEYLKSLIPTETADSDTDTNIVSDLDNTPDVTANADTNTDTNTGKFALIYVCDSDGTVLYARLINGNKINKENVSDWNCADGVTIEEDGSISVENSTESFAKVITYTQSFNINNLTNPEFSSDTDGLIGLDGVLNFPTDGLIFPEDFQIDDIPEVSAEPVNPESISDEITEKDNYIYSKDELKTMISDKEKEIEKLNLDKKQAEINLKKANKLVETGSEIATISGTVTFVAKDKNHLSENGYYITITSEEGMSVTATVGEFSLSKLEVGMEVSVESYDDGSTYNGTITEISDKPMTANSEMGGLSTESSYEFVVVVDGSFSLSEDSSVAITPKSEDQNIVCCLEMAFVREEGGRYYVYVANDLDILEKRYIKVGESYFGYYIDVVGGITLEDRIAFPYGNSAEGMPTVDASYNDLYGALSVLM